MKSLLTRILLSISKLIDIYRHSMYINILTKKEGKKGI